MLGVSDCIWESAGVGVERALPASNFYLMVKRDERSRYRGARKGISDMKIRWLLFLCFASLVVVFASLLTAIYLAAAKMLDTKEIAMHTHEVIERVEALRADLLDMEAGEMEYAISGGKPLLEHLTKDSDVIQSDDTAIRQLISDSPEQQKMIDRFEEELRNWLQTDVQPLSALRQEVDGGAMDLQAVIDFIRSGKGDAQVNTMLETLSEIKRSEFLLLERRKAALDHFTNLNRKEIIFGGGGGILLSLLISFLTARSLTRPLEELASYASHVSAGNYPPELKAKRKDEIGALANSLQYMVKKLADHIAIQERQGKLLDLAHDAILVRDMDSRIVYWNLGAERTYGWKADEAIGRLTDELLKTRFPTAPEELASQVVEKSEWQGELIHFTKSNVQIVVESRWVLQRDLDGTPLRFLEINRDITARKIAESSVRKYAEKLERSNQVLQDFAFVASHDLQEPLRKIRTFSKMLTDKYAEPLEGTGRDYLDRMAGAADRMSLLLESLLAYSRITTKAEPFANADLSDIVQGVLSDLEVPIHETGASVEIKDLPTIEADAGQMRHLFQNLVGNALKFHKAGMPPVVRVYGNPCRDGTCKIVVEDNGIGFDEAFSEKIFAPFQRLHGKSSSYKGAGMGLAICRKIVERHNGTITAASTPGRGSIFSICLPLEQSREESPDFVFSGTA